MLRWLTWSVPRQHAFPYALGNLGAIVAWALLPSRTALHWQVVFPGIPLAAALLAGMLLADLWIWWQFKLDSAPPPDAP